MGISRSSQTKHSVNSGITKQASLALALERLRDRVEGLKREGMPYVANAEVQDFVSHFAQSKIGPVATAADLVRISFQLAYQVLPALAHDDLGQFLVLWNNGMPPSVYFALLGAILQKVRLTSEQVGAFSCQSGKLTENTYYYLLSYPTPLALETEESDPEGPLNFAPEQNQNVGPYFTAVLDNTATHQIQFYNLVEGPWGSTTLRQLTADGNNSNCGPGPDPSAAAFLEALRERLLHER